MAESIGPGVTRSDSRAPQRRTLFATLQGADPSEPAIPDHMLNEVELSLAAKGLFALLVASQGNPSTRLTMSSKARLRSRRRLMSFLGRDWLYASRDERGGSRRRQRALVS